MTASQDLLLPDGSRIVHIGPHKTGTSSLQASFFAAREDAAAQGVLYASEGKHAMTADNRQTGSFILVDERSNKTVGAGVIGPATVAG